MRLRLGKRRAEESANGRWRRRCRTHVGANPVDSTKGTASREEAAAEWRRGRDHGTRSDEEPLAETGDIPHRWSVKRGKEMISLLVGGCPLTYVCNMYTTTLFYCLDWRNSSYCTHTLAAAYHGSLISALDTPTKRCRLPLYLLQATGRHDACVPRLSRLAHPLPL